MCGIAGLVRTTVRRGDVPLRSVGAKLLQSLDHRGPDSQGTWIDDDRGILLAHTRLAVVDLSETGAQPMASHSGRFVGMLNGEIYNHRALRAEMGQPPESYRGRSDTETLIEAFERWDVSPTLDRVDGMFAVAVWDRSTRTLTLARDRFGEKPLYWACGPQGFAFGSELRALRAMPGVDVAIDPEAAGSLLRWGFVAHPHTILRGVRQLAPGSLVSFGPDGIARESTWWSLPDVIEQSQAKRQTIGERDIAEELLVRLRASVRARLDADVPLGAFLSGGLDSSLVAALAQEALGSRSLHTFCVAMPSLGFDESATAANVAQHLGTRHTTVELSADDALALVPRLPQIYDEPLADPSCVPTALVCAAARRELTVCLGGDGGDELLGGYNRHVMARSIMARAERLPKVARHAIGRSLGGIRPSVYDSLAGGLHRVVPGHFAIPNAGDKAHKLGSLLRADGDLWPSVAGIWPADALRAHAPHFGAPAFIDDEVEALMAIDTAVVLPDNMLVKVDRASMAVALEVRSPFLHHELLAWAWTLPLDAKVAKGLGKRPSRAAAAQLLPESVLAKAKMGFDPPMGEWLRGPLREWADDLLLGPELEPWLDRRAVERTWRDHLSGRCNSEYRLWAATSLAAWSREYA